MKEQVWIGLWSNFRRRALRCFLYAAMMGMSLGLSSFASFRGQEIGSFVVRNSTLKDALKQLESRWMSASFMMPKMWKRCGTLR